MEKDVELLLEKLPDEKRQPAIRLYEIIMKTEPSLTTAIKWGNLTFVNGKSNLAFIYTYKTVDYINLGFLQATSLHDPKNLLQGTGKGMRHIKVRTVKDIPVAQVKAWVKEAVGE